MIEQLQIWPKVDEMFRITCQRNAVTMCYCCWNYILIYLSTEHTLPYNYLKECNVSHDVVTWCLNKNLIYGVLACTSIIMVYVYLCVYIFYACIYFLTENTLYPCHEAKVEGYSIILYVCVLAHFLETKHFVMVEDNHYYNYMLADSYTCIISHHTT